MVRGVAKRIVLGWAAAALVLALLPAVFHDNRYVMNLLILSFVWSAVAASWDLSLGYAKVFSFGQIAFMVIGGYTSGLLSIYLGISPWLGMIIGALTAGAVGVLIGIPCLRLSGMYLAIVTFAVQLVLPTLIVWAGPGRFEGLSTGGTFGLQRIPPLTLLGVIPRQDVVKWYYLGMVLYLLVLGGIYAVIRSYTGLAFIALRDAGPLARCLGVNEYKHKLMVFGISALVCGFMGGFYAHYLGSISPAVLGLDVFLLALVMVLFGGLGAFPGAALGAFVVNFVNEFLRPLLMWRLVALGAMVVVVMIYMPKGLMGMADLMTGLVRRFRKGGR